MIKSPYNYSYWLISLCLFFHLAIGKKYSQTNNRLVKAREKKQKGCIKISSLQSLVIISTHLCKHSCQLRQYKLLQEIHTVGLNFPKNNI